MSGLLDAVKAALYREGVIDPAAAVSAVADWFEQMDGPKLGGYDSRKAVKLLRAEIRQERHPTSDLPRVRPNPQPRQPREEQVVRETYTGDDLSRAWDEGHKDVCTDCNCPSSVNPYLNAPPKPTPEGVIEKWLRGPAEGATPQWAEGIAAALRDAGMLNEGDGDGRIETALAQKVMDLTTERNELKANLQALGVEYDRLKSQIAEAPPAEAVEWARQRESTRNPTHATRYILKAAGLTPPY